MRGIRGSLVTFALLTGILAWMTQPVSAQNNAGSNAERAKSAVVPATQPTGQFPAGIAIEEVTDADALRGLLASATEAALTKDGIGQLVERLTIRIVTVWERGKRLWKTRR